MAFFSKSRGELMGKALQNIGLLVLLLWPTACSDDAAQPRIEEKRSEVPSPVDSGAHNQTNKGQSPKQRDGKDAIRTSFAGFGRVERSMYEDVDYRARWAVIVGVNRFAHLSDLDNAVNDARALRNLLRDEFGYDDDRILYLADQGRDADGKFVDRSPVNKRDLIKAFDELASRDIRRNDAVLFFFAGHGLSDQSGTYLAAHDADDDDLSTWVDANELKQRLAAINARHKLVILDSCYAGSILEVDLSGANKNPASPKAEIESTTVTADPSAPRMRGGNEAMELRSNISYYLQEPAFLAITSGRNEAVSDGKGHSPFTSSLLKILRERANSVRDDDVFTARELAVQVERSVSSGQTPDWGRLGVGRGDYVFKPTVDRLTPREIAERDNYAGRLALAQSEASRGNVAYAFELLDSCPPHLRHFEWHHLRAGLDESVKIYPLKENERLTAMATNVDGSVVVAGTREGLIKVWTPGDAPSNPRIVGGFHKGSIASITFTPDGEGFVCNDSVGGLSVWSIDNLGIPIANSVMPGVNIHVLDFTPTDMRMVVSGQQDGKVYVLKLRENAQPEYKELLGVQFVKTAAAQKLQGVPDQGPAGFGMTSDGSRIVAHLDGGQISVWDGHNGGEPLFNLKKPGDLKEIKDLKWPGKGLADISHDGKRIVAMTGRGIDVWNVDQRDKPIQSIPIKRDIHWYPTANSVAFRPDSEQFVVAERGVISVHDVKPEVNTQSGAKQGTDSAIKTGLETKASAAIRFKSTSRVERVRFTGDGKTIMSGSESAIRMWDPQRRHHFKMNGISDAVIQPDGLRFASIDTDGKLSIWNAKRQGPPLLTINAEKPGKLQFSNDGKRIFVARAITVEGSNEVSSVVISAWDAIQTGAPIASIEFSDVDRINFAPSPTGDRIAVSHKDRSVRIYDVTRKSDSDADQPAALPETPVVLKPPFDRFTDSDFTFTPDGKKVVTGGPDRHIRIWSAEKEGPPLVVFEDHVDMILGIDVSHDGKRIASAAKNGVKYWNAETGKHFLSQKMGDATWLQDVRFSIDSNRVMARSFGESVIYDPDRGGPAYLVLTGGSKHFGIKDARFGPNGGVAIALYRGELLVWTAWED